MSDIINNQIYTTIAIFLIGITIYHIIFSKYTEHMGANDEAISYIASLYNNKKMTVDDLVVKNNITVEGDGSFKKNLKVENGTTSKYFQLDGRETAHKVGEGIFYRYGGQVYIGCDDIIRFRDNTHKKEMEFNVATNNVTIGSKKITDRRMRLITSQNTPDNTYWQITDAKGKTYGSDWVLGVVGINMDWTSKNPGRLECFTYFDTNKKLWYLRTEIEGEKDTTGVRILAIPKEMFEYSDYTGGLSWSGSHHVK